MGRCDIHCPPEGGRGVLTVAAVVVAAALAAPVAGPVVHAVTVAVRVVVIAAEVVAVTAGVLAGVAVTAVLVLAARRLYRLYRWLAHAGRAVALPAAARQTALPARTRLMLEAAKPPVHAVITDAERIGHVR